jgi:hypothetical protein
MFFVNSAPPQSTMRITPRDGAVPASFIRTKWVPYNRGEGCLLYFRRFWNGRLSERVGLFFVRDSKTCAEF